MSHFRFRVRPIVTQMALIGMAIDSARDSFWRDIVFSAVRIVPSNLGARHAYLGLEVGRAS